VFDGRFRTELEQRIAPIGTGLRRIGVNADVLTGLGLVIAGAAAFTIGHGWLKAGLLLVICAALPDLLDGAVAKAGQSASKRGAFFDSVADRATDFLLFGGVGWYLASAKGSQWAMLPFAVAGASSLISYERAKAEALGFNARGGLMERAERIILLLIGLLFDWLLVPILWVMLALTLMTAGQRFVKVWKQASVDRPVPVIPPRVLRRDSRFAQQREMRLARRAEARDSRRSQ
jgi:CDP-diacylglycerol---glycerol-3-phosphate 3-phosphatidyltransferase